MSEARCSAIDWVLDALGAHGTTGELRCVAPDAIDWHHVVRFASSHLVLPALAERIGDARVQPPKEVAGFFTDIAAQNASRNGCLRAALRDIGRVLGDLSAPPVVLKGGAFLLDGDEGDGAGAWRFMSDLDVLVAAADLARAHERLVELGYQATAGDEGGAAHHAPPLIAPSGTFSVELHTRLSDRDEGGPSPEQIWAGAMPAGEGLWVPRAADRLAHMIAHAQLHNRNAVLERLVLKDVLDLKVLGGAIDIDGELLDAAFPAGRARWAAGALVAAGQVFAVAPRFSPSRSEQGWAKRALARLKRAAWRERLALPLDMARLERFRLRNEPGHLGRRFELLASPRELAGAAGRWAYKQRQRLWA